MQCNYSASFETFGTSWVGMHKNNLSTWLCIIVHDFVFPFCKLTASQSLGLLCLFCKNPLRPIQTPTVNSYKVSKSSFFGKTPKEYFCLVPLCVQGRVRGYLFQGKPGMVISIAWNDPSGSLAIEHKFVFALLWQATGLFDSCSAQDLKVKLSEIAESEDTDLWQQQYLWILKK